MGAKQNWNLVIGGGGYRGRSREEGIHRSLRGGISILLEKGGDSSLKKSRSGISIWHVQDWREIPLVQGSQEKNSDSLLLLFRALTTDPIPRRGGKNTFPSKLGGYRDSNIKLHHY